MTSNESTGSPRERELTYSAAVRCIETAHDEGARRGIAISAAVVDQGGRLVAFGRMDGAEIAGTTLATDKAFTAVANSTTTEELAVLAAPGGELFGLHANGGGHFVIFGGGIPLKFGDLIVGGVGVSGSTVENDVACAARAAASWSERG